MPQVKICLHPVRLPTAPGGPRLTTAHRVCTSPCVQKPSSSATPPPFPRLVLASGSPRRSEILSDAKVAFEIIVSGVDEQTREGEAPEDLAARLAEEKCLDVAMRLPGNPARPVLGADTIVVAGEDVLGKPRDAEHAVELLSLLVGTTHRVMTGIAVAWTDDRGPWSAVTTSHVEMRSATRQELIDYVAVGESLDKAGGYALQGEGARFIVSVRGSRTNVIGLPLQETLALLGEAGVPDAALTTS